METYDYIISSDHEDLVGSSSSGGEDEDDFEYVEEVQFRREKRNPKDKLPLIDCAPLDRCTSLDDSRVEDFEEQTKQWAHFLECRKTIQWLIFYGLSLLASSLGLFVVFPLYQKQLQVGSMRATAHGTIIFSAITITLLLAALAYCTASLFKWKNGIFCLPDLPIKRFLLTSLCCGVAMTLCTVSTYDRVTCHLQDPLKGIALVAALTFYFFFCKRVMGLQKVFSATTGVVGLFICVDYGLCDEYRCHGISISTKSIIATPGWQGRAFWTLTYIIGIVLWTLHLSLLEGELVMISSIYTSNGSVNGLLKTISRLVSNADQAPEPSSDRPLQQIKRKPKAAEKPKPIHLALWIHIISVPILLLLGIIDAIPNSGSEIKTFSEHWTYTGNTVLCHFGINHFEQGTSNQQHNATVVPIVPPRANRTRRLVQSQSPDHVNRKRTHYIQTAKRSSHRDTHAFKQYKNRTFITTPPGSQHPTEQEPRGPECSRVRSYIWMVILFYIAFVLSLLSFLVTSESAVFAVAMMTGSLPFLGLFWSVFKLEVAKGGIVFLAWVPSITGELICSLLGTPIVFLGIVLLYRAHFNEILRSPATSHNPIAYTSLSEA